MRIKVLLVLMLSIGLGSGWSSPLGAASQSAEALLQEGILRFKVGQFKQAVRLLKRAQKKAAEPEIQARVNLHLGLSYGVLGQRSLARAAFDRALRADPTVDLDPAETKQDLLELFSQVRQGITGKLEVSANREGAVVRIDGAEVGPAPYSGQMPVGRHRVEATTSDMLYGYQGEVVIQAGATKTLRVELSPLKGLLDVSSSPAGATVMLGDRELGSSPMSGVLLAPGEHQLKLVLEGHRPETRTIRISAGATASVRVTLTPLSPDQTGQTQADRPAGRRGRLWTWITAGTAVAAAGTGLAFGLLARSSWNTYKNAAAEGDARTYNDMRDKVSTRSTVANISFAAAGALAVTAAVLYLFVEKPDRTDRARAAVGPSQLLFSYEF